MKRTLYCADIDTQSVDEGCRVGSLTLGQRIMDNTIWGSHHIQKCFVRINRLVLNFRSISALNTVDGRSNVENRYSTLLGSVIYISGLAFSNLRTINPSRESCIESFHGFSAAKEVCMLLLWLQINSDEDAQCPSLAM